MLAFFDDRSLVYAGALVGTKEFDDLIFVGFNRIVAFDNNAFCVNFDNSTCVFGKNGYAGVNCSFIFHTGTDIRSFGFKKRNCLALHVRTHESTVCVVVFKEGDHCGCNGNYHLRRYVHVVNFFRSNFDEFVFETAGYFLVCKTVFFIEGGVSLCNDEVVLCVSSHIFDFVENDTGFFINFSEGSFNKAVFVDSCIACEVGDKTDVRTFRGLDRAHASVMAVVYVSNFETCTVTGKTAGAESGETTLMSKFCKRVGLIHELGKRRRSEELLDSRNDGADIHKTLRSDGFGVLCLDGHAFTDYALNSGETDSELVLKKFADTADTSVSEMVDIVGAAKAPIEVEHIVDGREDIIGDDMFRDKFVNVLFEESDECFFIVACFFSNCGDNGETNFFVDEELFEFFFGKVYIIFGIDHVVGDNFDLVTVNVNKNFANTFFVKESCVISGKGCACFEKNFAGKRICCRFCKGHACNTSFESKFFVVFVTSDAGDIISSCVEEEVVEVLLTGFDRGRFTGTKFSVNFEKCLFSGFGCVFFKSCEEHRLFAEIIKDLCVTSESKGSDESGDGKFSVLIDSYAENIVKVAFVFKPCTSVRDNSACEKFLTGFVVVHGEIYAGRTDKLGYNNTLCAVNYKSAGRGHNREISHEDILFFDLAGFLILQSCSYTKGGCISHVALFAFLDGIFGLVFDMIIDEVQNKVSGIISDGRNITENFLKTFFKEPSIRVFLNLDEVRHIEDFLDLGKTHADIFSELDRFYIYQISSLHSSVLTSFIFLDRNTCFFRQTVV